jgi:hypothetical protein
MRAVPMVADFGVRLAFGLAVALVLTSLRTVPLRFFRIQALLILGVLVLAGMGQARASGMTPAAAIVVAAAIASYLATIAWGLGIPRPAQALSILTAVAALAWLCDASRSDDPAVWAFKTVSRIASGFLMGSALSSMLLGHYYLIAPAMTTEPLRWSVKLTALGLGARFLLACTGLLFARFAVPGTDAWRAETDAALLAARWGMGFAGAAVSIYLARRTVAMHSTQSATGILYITTIFICFGELTSLVAAGGGLIGW